jgi:hypothetical protein
MKDLKLTIKINKPVKDMFEFTLNPKNTPKWIDAIVIEQTNEWPAKLGTIYRNQDTAGEWRELEITAFEKDKMFVLSSKNGYHVRYAFVPIDENSTEFEYTEWMDNGELKDLLTMEVLEKLKQKVEE